MRKLIINADDFGYSEHTVEWTVKGFESNRLTSATIMAGFPGTAQAVEYAKAHPQFSFGAHLYLVDEKPMSNPESISSMIDPSTGKLWATKHFIPKALTGRISKEDLKREMRAQILSLRTMGLNFSHVDGHGHMHRLPVCLSALIELKEELGIRTMRRTQDLHFVRPGYAGRLVNLLVQRKLMKNFNTTDHFLMTAGKTSDAKWFAKSLEAMPEGVTEIGIHPGVDEDWRKLDTLNAYECQLPADIQLVSYNQI